MDSELAAQASQDPTAEHPAALPAAPPSSPFDHGTDAEILQRRLSDANPLASRSPHPGNVTSALRRQVLYALRTAGPASPDQIATSIGASRTGVLQQLRTLETAGLVSRTLIRHGVGRPRHVYDLTPSAQELFPANYGGLAQSMLSALRSLGGDRLVADVFEARRRQLSARLAERLQERLPAGSTLWERARELAAFQDESGYIGRVARDEDGTIRVSEHNCAIYDVSGAYPMACASELQLFSEVLGAKVTRECHIAGGARSCTYRVEPLED